MNFFVIYISPNGTTKKVAEMLKSIIEKSEHSVELIDIGCKEYRENPLIVFEKLKEADVVGFGSPAYHMDMLYPMRKFFADIFSGNNRYTFKAFFYINYAGITSGKALLNAAIIFREMQIPIIGAFKIKAPHFHHNEKFPAIGDEEYIQTFYNTIQKRNFNPIEPKQLLSELSPKKTRVSLLYPFIHLVGKKREIKISVIEERCKSCGKCARECPVGAISIDGFANIDFTECIHCYHCTVACKFKAIEAPVEKLDKMIKINKKVIGTETPVNEIF